jgi:predicted GNAT family N-acyltransferase
MKANSPTPLLQVVLIQDQENLDFALAIRHQVFVVEQKVDPTEEYDSFDPLEVHSAQCAHFLAQIEGKAVGTARLRKTAKGVKLERFAVLPEARKSGAGRALIHACLKHLPPGTRLVYLHAQEHALGFYEKAGFQPVGDRFFEAGIPHFKMQLEIERG